MKILSDGTVCSPKGFRAAGVCAGIKRSGNLDTMLLVSDVPAQAAAAFTANSFAAAPVIWCREVIASASPVRAIAVNSGNANACTGRQGYSDAVRMAAQVAECLDCSQQEVLISSTGRIGVQLPMDKILAGIMLAANELSADNGALATKAIMTTDTVPKSCAVSFEVGDKTITIGGMTKGAGMIAPRMVPATHATMLAYLTTDANIDSDFFQECLAESLDASFNRINIDGDTSTNDTYILLANGLAGNSTIRKGTFEGESFQAALDKVAGELARQMVMDGEGVTKFVEVHVSGAASRDEAYTCADAISRSLLCKTAWFGCDPNWGRILCAAGYSGVNVNTDRVHLDYDGVAIVRNGADAGVPEETQAKAIDKRVWRLDLDLGVGDGEYTMWTNDLTYEYVKINADYHT